MFKQNILLSSDLTLRALYNQIFRHSTAGKYYTVARTSFNINLEGGGRLIRAVSKVYTRTLHAK